MSVLNDIARILNSYLRWLHVDCLGAPLPLLARARFVIQNEFVVLGCGLRKIVCLNKVAAVRGSNVYVPVSGGPVSANVLVYACV